MRRWEGGEREGGAGGRGEERRNVEENIHVSVCLSVFLSVYVFVVSLSLVCVCSACGIGNRRRQTRCNRAFETFGTWSRRARTRHTFHSKSKKKGSACI